MNQGISTQIQKMVRFILQEAEEKANEISISAEEESNILKLKLVEDEKRKIRDEYKHKEKQVGVRKRMLINESRIKVLQAQDDLVNATKESSSKQLLQVSGYTNTQRKLLKDLTVQCLLRLKEPLVLLRCREVDRKLVECVLDEAKQEYAEKAKVHLPKVTIDHVYLPPSPVDVNSHNPFCSGGVVLASQDGKTVKVNTLDARLELAFVKKQT